MKLFLLPLLLLTFVIAPAMAQTDRVELLSDKPGRAEAKVSGLMLHADQATLNRETGELQMRGHVHVALPAREDHVVVRYEGKVMLNDQPMGITADRVTVKNGLLQATGGIVIVPVDEKLPKVMLKGDEFFMYLRIGDATLKGNIRTSGFSEPVDYRGNWSRQPIFPPDIIK